MAILGVRVRREQWRNKEPETIPSGGGCLVWRNDLSKGLFLHAGTKGENEGPLGEETVRVSNGTCHSSKETQYEGIGGKMEKGGRQEKPLDNTRPSRGKESKGRVIRSIKNSKKSSGKSVREGTAKSETKMAGHGIRLGPVFQKTNFLNIHR